MRQPQHAAAQPPEAVALPGTNDHGGVQIEAARVGMARADVKLAVTA